MKKTKIPFFFIFLVMGISFFTAAHALSGSIKAPEKTNLIKQSVFNNTDSIIVELPAALEIIDENAFEGTNLLSVNLPESVITVGDYAFANIPTLRIVSIPSSITIIGNKAFEGSSHVIMSGTSDGYAKGWAKRNNIPFISIKTFYANIYLTHSMGFSVTYTKEIGEYYSRGQLKNDQKETGYMESELKAIKKEKDIAFHVQGRSPPI